MALNLYKDFRIMDLDPVQEITGRVVKRKKARRPRTFFESEVIFFKTILVFIECLVPACKGHQKYGQVLSENLPVIFKYHDFGEQARYIAFKNPICKPMRVPLDGDALINGIKWRLTNPLSIYATTQGIFDCLIASLKFLTLTKDFCIECLFQHENGLGHGLEKFLKTVLYHVVVYGRFMDKEVFKPILAFEKGMSLRFCRIYWEEQGNMFKTACSLVKSIPYIYHEDDVSENFVFSIPNVIIPEYPSKIKHGVQIDPNSHFLRHLNTISSFFVTIQCHCFGKKPYPKIVYTSLIRRNKRSNDLHLSLAEWRQRGNEYFDPLFHWSLLGPDTPSTVIPSVNQARPISSLCNVCKNAIYIRDIHVPKTTWLLIAEIDQALSKVSVDHFASISTYSLGDVEFELKLVLLYNTVTGHFTSMHLVQDEWYFFDDKIGGIFKRCSPYRVKYKDRVNLRVVYMRKTETNPHLCLQNVL